MAWEYSNIDGCHDEHELTTKFDFISYKNMPNDRFFEDKIYRYKIETLHTILYDIQDFYIKNNMIDVGLTMIDSTILHLN